MSYREIESVRIFVLYEMVDAYVMNLIRKGICQVKVKEYLW